MPTATPDHNDEPPPGRAVFDAPRLRGLDETSAKQVVGAAAALSLGRADQAEQMLAPTLVAHPGHPEVLRLHAGVLNLRGDYAGALGAMDRALEQRPVDALYHNTLGTILGTMGDYDAAVRALHRACELQPDLASAWYNLGVMLTRCVRVDEAAKVLRRAVELAPDNVDARVMLGDMLRTRGRIDESAVEYRSVLQVRPSSGMAWWGLAELRSGALGPEDVDRMGTVLRQVDASDDDRIATGFALARVLDEQGRCEDSLRMLEGAHALARRRQHWGAAAYSAAVQASTSAFTPPPMGAPVSGLGHAVIFIVGMPRSGTTLVEQILASHSQVEGSGELPDLPLVMAEEVRRRGKRFPHWVSEMQPRDWQRLGERYLERTSHWRRRKPAFTDKLPNNWAYIGAIRAMLPGARIIVCRRDPLETCFSCYRQYLVNNEYTRTPNDLAAFWRDFDRSVTHWARLHPANVYQHDYETLLSQPESSIRALLDACKLGFEDACLDFFDTQRDVHSPSASQVRQRLRTDTARAQRYGALLDPLRQALGLPRFGAGDGGA